MLPERVCVRPTRMMRSHSERRSEEHTSELQSLTNLVCRLLLETKKFHLATKTHQSPAESSPSHLNTTNSLASSRRQNRIPDKVQLMIKERIADQRHSSCDSEVP